MANKGFERFLPCGGQSRVSWLGRGHSNGKDRAHPDNPSWLRQRVAVSGEEAGNVNKEHACFYFARYLSFVHGVLACSPPHGCCVSCGGSEGCVFSVAPSEIATGEEVPLLVPQLTIIGGLEPNQHLVPIYAF